MAKKETINIRRIGRYIFGFIAGLLLLSTFLFIAFQILPFDLPLYLFLLIFLLFISPAILAMIYVLSWAFIPVVGRMPAKGLRQWAVAYGLGVSYIFYFGLLAFIFETLTPTIPTFYRGIFLPQFIILITVLILTRTRLRSQVEQFLKRLFKENSNK